MMIINKIKQIFVSIIKFKYFRSLRFKKFFFETAQLSDIGDGKVNQDALGNFTESGRGCWVVADGLGGHKGGEIASEIAKNVVLETLKGDKLDDEISEDIIRRSIESAQTYIIGEQSKNPLYSRMRTTIVVLIIEKGFATWGHLGDTRLYLFRNGRLKFQTSDHSVVWAKAVAGDIQFDDIRFHEDRNFLLRSLGNEMDCSPEISKSNYSVKDKDAFLLCTDGFWEFVTEDEMLYHLASSNSPANWLERMGCHIRESPPRNQKKDNYSAIAVWCQRIDK